MMVFHSYMSGPHLAVVGLIFFLVLFPVARVLQRAGYSAWWCLVFVFPLFGLIALWVFAYADWPNLPRAQAPSV